jgi:hypothetical protein
MNPSSIPRIKFKDYSREQLIEIASEQLKTFFPDIIVPRTPLIKPNASPIEADWRSDFSNRAYSEIRSNADSAPRIRELFKDQIVVDLGAGGSDSKGGLIAQLCGARAYIAVELHNYEWGGPSFYGENKILVPLDMKSFVAALPDQSVSFIMLGVGSEITSSRPHASEIFRTLHTKGFLMVDSASDFDAAADTRLQRDPDILSFPHIYQRSCK